MCDVHKTKAVVEGAERMEEQRWNTRTGDGKK